MNRMAISRPAGGFFMAQVLVGCRDQCEVHGANGWRVYVFSGG
jgi:hypothetical protein